MQTLEMWIQTLFRLGIWILLHRQHVACCGTGLLHKAWQGLCKPRLSTQELEAVQNGQVTLENFLVYQSWSKTCCLRRCRAVAEVLTGTLQSFRPDLVLYDAGVDPHVDDKLGRLSLTDQGLFRRELQVTSCCG